MWLINLGRRFGEGWARFGADHMAVAVVAGLALLALIWFVFPLWVAVLGAGAAALLAVVSAASWLRDRRTTVSRN